MKITGELLKSERIKRDLKIQDVAYSLKLSSRIIMALEDGDIAELPSKTFIRGFVKSYAEYLKLDSAAVLRQFQEEMGSTHPVPRVPPPKSFQEQQSTNSTQNRQEDLGETVIQRDYSSGFTKKNTFVFIGIALLVLTIALVNQFITKYQKEADVTSTQQELLGQSISSDSSLQTNALASVPSSLDSTLVSADNQSANLSNDNLLTKPLSQEVSAASFQTPEPSVGKPVEILIEAKKDTQFEFAKGNTNQFQKINLKKNAFQLLKSNAGLHLRTMDGSSLHVTVNGVSKGTLSTNEKPVQITY